MDPIVELSARQLRDAVAKREVSCEQATAAYLERIDALDPALHAYNEVWRDEALVRARSLDRALASGERPGILAGVPVALKDNLCTTDGHTTCSSRILAGYRAPYMATVVRKLEQAGAVILGKTNMDEFAMGSSTETSATGATRNPWDTGRVAGGSSGGSAAAVSARLAAAALGSDTGGSIRQPAAFCGVLGIKPTYGRVSRYGLVAYGSSLDQIGPLTRDAADAALVLTAVSGHDPMDSTSVDHPVADYVAGLDEAFRGRRVGVVAEFASAGLHPEVAAALESAAARLRQAGAELVDVSLPHSRIQADAAGGLSSYAVACYYVIAMAEASSNLSRYDGVHYGHRTARDASDIVDMTSRSRREGFGEETRRRIMLGTFALSSGYYDAYYLKALKVRRLIKEDFDRAFARCDLILCPATPGVAFRPGERTADPLQMYLEDLYTISVNLAGLPALVLPCGRNVDGLPIGAQLIGPVFSEARLLATARACEQAWGGIGIPLTAAAGRAG
jgi:aspartyl-tRNA(Asn)/glutamyl-tRNA(Gln) amidotransferase subunit A